MRKLPDWLIPVALAGVLLWYFFFRKQSGRVGKGSLSSSSLAGSGNPSSSSKTVPPSQNPFLTSVQQYLANSGGFGSKYNATIRPSTGGGKPFASKPLQFGGGSGKPGNSSKGKDDDASVDPNDPKNTQFGTLDSLSGSDPFGLGTGEYGTDYSPDANYLDSIYSGGETFGSDYSPDAGYLDSVESGDYGNDFGGGVDFGGDNYGGDYGGDYGDNADIGSDNSPDVVGWEGLDL